MTLEISEGSTLSGGIDFDTSAGSVELGNDLRGVNSLLNSGGARTARQVNNKLGQIQTLNADDLTLDFRCGTVDQNLRQAGRKIRTDVKEARNDTLLWSRMSTMTATLFFSSP